MNNSSSPKKKLKPRLNESQGARWATETSPYHIKGVTAQEKGKAAPEKEDEQLKKAEASSLKNGDANIYRLGDRRIKEQVESISRQLKESEDNYKSHSKIKHLRHYSQHLFDPDYSVSDHVEITEDPYLKLSKAVELSPSIILMTDRLGIIEYANPTFLEVSGFKEFEIYGRGLELFKPDLSSRKEYSELRKSINRGEEWKGELENCKKSGEIFIFSASITPVRNEYDLITNFIIVGQDVTPFRETEKQLKSAVEEKTVLLSELHHRVKNNLAIISGLMQLQAFTEDNKEVQGKLYSSVGRVQTMASMHELLYESGSFSKLEFGQNLKKIVSSISKMYYDEGKKVEVTFDVEAVQLNINQAHPCSLLLNEVITNSFKHAFKDLEKGKIHIQLYAKEKTVYISIFDNGRGLPEGFDTKTTDEGLGNTLLNTLVRQLGGSFQYASGSGGTTFTLTFKKDDIKGSANATFS